jgi:hypothetical protein
MKNSLIGLHLQASHQSGGNKIIKYLDNNLVEGRLREQALFF